MRWSALALLLGAAMHAAAQDRVVLQLRFDHQFQFAGYYAAMWNGYYRDAGIEVELRSGVRPNGSLVAAMDEVAAGRADFGIGAGDALIARSNGVPVVLLASIFQQSAVEVVARADTELRAPGDLVGREVLSGNHPLVDAEFSAMLAAEGVPPDSVPLIPIPPPYSVTKHFGMLFDGEVDAMLAYALSFHWQAKERGFPYVRLRPSAYGVDFYGDSLFAHQRLVNERPDLVERFRAASVKGWRYALEHMDEVSELIAQRLPRTVPVRDRRAYNDFLALRVKDLALYPTVEVGHVNPMRWQAMNGALRRAGLVRGDLDLQQFVFDPERLRRAELEAQHAQSRNVFMGAAAALLSIALYFATRRLLERNRSRAELQRVNRALRTLTASNRVLTRARNEAEYLREVVNHVVRDGGYRYACIAATDDEDALRPVAQAGDSTSDVLAFIERQPVDAHRGLLAAAAIGGRARQLPEPPPRGNAGAANMAPTKPFGAVLALPIRWPDGSAGALAVMAVERGEFDPREVEVLEELASDVAYGVAGLRREERRRRAEKALEDSETNLRALTASLEQRVQERTQALTSHVQALESFNRNVSHDLRGPLGGIAGLAPLARRHLDSGRPGDAARLLDAMGEQAEHSMKLVEALLDLARAESRPLQVRRVSTASLVRDVVTTLHAAGSPRASIEIDPSIPEVVADPDLLRQVFANLIGNAVKFTGDADAPRVQVGVERRGSDVTFFVRDNGVGFSPEQAHRMFQPFERLHGSAYEGFGVGLSVVKRVIDRHGGKIWAESNGERGAAFYFKVRMAD